MIADQMGVCKDIPVKVHYNESSLANILSMATLINTPGITIEQNTAVEPSIFVHIKGRHSIKVKKSDHGLFYYDYRYPEEHLLNAKPS